MHPGGAFVLVLKALRAWRASVDDMGGAASTTWAALQVVCDYYGRITFRGVRGSVADPIIVR